MDSIPFNSFRRISLLLLLIAAGFYPVPVEAQAICLATEKVTPCLNRLVTELKGVPTEEAAKSQSDVQKKTETGLQDISGLSSSVKDFLPLLQLTGVLGAVQTDEKTGSVSVALNTPFLGKSGITDDPSLQLKAVIETKSKLFDPLRSQLPVDERDDIEKGLLAAHTEAENVTLHGSYNFLGRRLGRNFAQHMRLYNLLVEKAAAAPLQAVEAIEANAIRKLTTALGTLSMDDTLWIEIPEAQRGAAQAAMLEVAQAHNTVESAFAKLVKATGLDMFGQLVNNQPQISVDVSRTFRDDLFGPDLTSGRITWEMGLSNNLNNFFDVMDTRQCTQDVERCLQVYSSYVNDAETKANLKAGSRVALSAEFVSNAEYHYTNVDLNLDYALAKGTSFMGGVDYGRLLGVSDTGAAAGRVDATIRWEWRPDAPDDTRFLAGVTITKKVGELAIPFGIVYANKPKFLTGVDQGLTANIGLKFNLFHGLK
jgi:hypothetical protein